MLNTSIALPLKTLIILVLATAAVSGALTYTVLHLSPTSVPVCPAVACPNICTRTPAQEAARKQYFKVHQAKLNGEGF